MSKPKVYLGYFFKFKNPSPRDYKADVEAITASKLSTWKLEHFGAWADLCAPPAMPAALPSAAEVLELEDQANAARFRELRAKIAQDCASMTQFNAQSEEGKRRSHVVQVTHERSQIEVGKKLLGKNNLTFERFGFLNSTSLIFELYFKTSSLSRGLMGVQGYVKNLWTSIAVLC